MTEEPNTTTEEEATGASQTEAPQRLNLDVKVESRGACQRHVTVSISREDVDRYFSREIEELLDKAQVPGFRPGKAPRKLVESRFRKDVTERIKGVLVLDSLSQVTEDNKLAAISEPDMDPGAIEVPSEGPMTFEFDLEVRPDFELPNWKGLALERPHREISEKDIDGWIRNYLSNYGRLVAKEGPAELGDYLSCDLTIRNGDEVLSESKERVIRIRPQLSFQDGMAADFGKVMVGVTAGETRQVPTLLSQDAPREELRGKQVLAELAVHEVKRLELPEINEEFLRNQVGAESPEEFREMIRKVLSRQLLYHQQQRARQQITKLLTVTANWDLPPELLARQEQREMERARLELQRAGFPTSEIRARENELRQNAKISTARALKEHFILERIAEEEKIDASPEDYENEIELLAQQSNESVRRVRAQLEKRGLMDTLRNQIVERKTLQLIESHAQFKDVPFQFETSEAEAVEESASGGGPEEQAIPEAKYASEPASQLPEKRD